MNENLWEDWFKELPMEDFPEHEQGFQEEHESLFDEETMPS
ncbi:MAG: hypothetical protein Q4B82_01930 [Alysiella sp.]|nr:hypothetical protein [Alysiella sp.]MDO4433322.1 hypothetical protein [Alysiella sp.]